MPNSRQTSIDQIVSKTALWRRWPAVCGLHDSRNP